MLQTANGGIVSGFSRIQRRFSWSEPSASPAPRAPVDKCGGRRRFVPKRAGLLSGARARPARSTAHRHAYREARWPSQSRASHRRPPYPGSQRLCVSRRHKPNSCCPLQTCSAIAYSFQLKIHLWSLFASKMLPCRRARRILNAVPETDGSRGFCPRCKGSPFGVTIHVPRHHRRIRRR